MNSILKSKKCSVYTLIFGIHIIFLSALYGQAPQSVTGILRDQSNQEEVSYATVTIYDAVDSNFIAGTLSNEKGEFMIYPEFDGNGYLKVSFIGYKPIFRDMDFTGNGNYDMGTLFLEEEMFSIHEAVITVERIKAQDEIDRTTYFVNKKIYDASNTGVDVLKHIPGVGVDMMHNISLEGSSNILFLVDGRERDKNFISQLDAHQIDKVQIMSVPGSQYDANISGVINLVLKKEKNLGVSGHFYTELPMRESEIYSFPAYGLNIGFKKLNFFTSYNGDIRYFNITESYERIQENTTAITEIRKNYYFRQKDGSHRFHFGVDYFLNDKNQFNFYSFYNPYLNYDAGRIVFQTLKNDVVCEDMLASKEDKDSTRMSYYSLYFKHFFNKPGQDITLDINYFNFKSNRTIRYSDYILSGIYLDDEETATVPTQHTISMRIDFTSPVTDRIKIDAGTKALFIFRGNNRLEHYDHEEKIYAGYASLLYKDSKLNVNLGLRAEMSSSGLSESFTRNILAVLPHAVVSYELSSKQIVKLSYRRQINRPIISQLDPGLYVYDPFTVYSGNPEIKPEFHDNLFLDYSIRFGNNYITNRLFYIRSADVIQNLSFLSDTILLKAEAQNLGNMDYVGYQFTGSLTLFKSFTMNPYFKAYVVHTFPGDLASQYFISGKHKMAFESGISAILAFKYDITASLFYQYNNAIYDMQSKSSKGALYFISLEKTFQKKLKLGAMACLPFIKSFNDQEVFISGENYQYHTNRVIHLSSFAIMIKLGYRFSSGKKINKIDRKKDIIDTELNNNF